MATIDTSAVELRSSRMHRPVSAGDPRPYSSYLDPTPVPDNVGIGSTPTISNSFDSASTDARKIMENLARERKSIMRSYKRNSESRPQTAPVNNNVPASSTASLRSAKYLATQWRSRSTQWSASSSMRGFSESSSLPSSPPPALKEKDSDSDSDFSVTDASVDESVMSQVSEARSVLESWKLRASMSRDSEDNEDEFGDSLRSFETQKTRNNTHKARDEFRVDPSSHYTPFERTLLRSGHSNRKKVSSQPNPGTSNIDGPSAPFGDNSSFTKADPRQANGYASPRTVLSPSNSKQSKNETYESEISNLYHREEIQMRNAKKANRTDIIKTPEPLKRTYPVAHGKLSKNSSGEVLQLKPSKPIKWEEYDFVFTFGLLTNGAKAPPEGDYIPDDECYSYRCKLAFKSKLLYDILNKFADNLRQIRSLSNERGKYMMCPPDCTPAVKNVRRDGE